MFSFNFSNFRYSLGSFSIISISLNFDKGKNGIKYSENKPINNNCDSKSIIEIERDYKTTLSWWNVNLIEDYNEDIIAYLFIQKEASTAWHLVTPIIRGCATNKILQYGFGGFALEGMGRGLINTESIFYELRKIKEKGYNITVIPKVINNDVIVDFQYCDTVYSLEDLDKKSINLYNYDKGKHSWIRKQFDELYKKYLK